MVIFKRTIYLAVYYAGAGTLRVRFIKFVPSNCSAHRVHT